MTAGDVLQTFCAATHIHGYPASLLTDNGAVFTGRSRRFKVMLEAELERLGITSKHSRPYHPQTCGKVERFHQTLKKYLAKQAPAPSLAVLQLRTTGQCTVTLPEELFDMDGPGHYFRRIKSVAMSIPSVTGPIGPTATGSARR